MTSTSASPGDTTAPEGGNTQGLRRRRREQHSSDPRTSHDFAAAPALIGPTVRLEQLDHAHVPGLSQAAEDLGDLWVTAIPSSDGMETEIDRRLGLQEAGSMAPFTVVDLQSETPVGMTTFMNIDAPNRRVEIGSTWLSPRVHGGRTNPEMKLMMLTRAFDELDCIAVEFRTHFHNHHSRRAIEKLGAKQDGILRSHTLHRGVLRDTAVYSIIAAEWPTVRFSLEQRLRDR